MKVRLPVTFILIASGAAQVPATDGARDARKLLQRIAESYRKFESFEWAGVTAVTSTAAK